jgi:uncharacterized OB-fold protein
MQDAGLKAILPRPTAASAPFWEACNREELLLCGCEDCNALFYYPRIFCPRCAGRKLRWVPSRGTGRVFSHTRVDVSFYGSSWQSQLPYYVILVDLDEGVRMLSRLIGEDCELVRSGDRVEVAFAEIEGRKLPFFRRIGAT